MIYIFDDGVTVSDPAPKHRERPCGAAKVVSKAKECLVGLMLRTPQHFVGELRELNIRQ